MTEMHDHLNEFLTLAEEHLGAAEGLFLLLERNPGDEETINELFRHYHSLKGDSGVVGAGSVELLSHEIESVLDRVRSGEFAATESCIDLILEASARLRSHLHEFGHGQQGAVDQNLLERLRSCTQGTAAVQTRSENIIQEAEEGRDAYIIFDVGQTLAAISVQEGHEIIERPAITPLPQVESFIAGVINHQGKIIPVLNLRDRLGLDQGSDPLVLVLFFQGTYVAFLISGVRTVADFSGQALFKPDSEMLRLDWACVQAAARWQDQIVFLLDPGAVLQRNTLNL
ncbi:MAG: chemotaxis protein CheW [Spirochaetales bacterium]|nr:chemotaxis protein CheW [Spirochaetales bacterium]